MELSPNEFIDNNDSFGFLAPEKEPYEFLSIDKVQEKIVYNSEPKFSLYLTISDTRYESERQVYTIFTMIGDIGGFNGAITILPAFFLAKYNSAMYIASISRDVKIRSKRKKRAGA